MSELDFEQLIARLSKKGRTAPQMVQAMVELTYGCNLRCVHCYNPTHEAKNERSTEEVCRTLDQLAAEGCLWVGFTGGELFTRRDAMEILQYAKRLGLVMTILTNATMITSALADQVQALKPYQLEISVYGATPQTYERVTRVPGSFVKFVRGTDLLNERGIPILLKLVLMTLNVHELEPMRAFALTRQLPYKLSTEIHPKADGSIEPLAYRLSPNETFEIWRRISGERQREYRTKRLVLEDSGETSHLEEERCGSAGQLFACLCGKSSAAVTPYGMLNLCLSFHYPQYDLTKGGVAEGWKWLVELVAQAKPGPEYQCAECPLAKYCTRGTIDGWLQQGVFDGPCIPYFREVAEQKAEFLKETAKTEGGRNGDK